MAKYRITSPDGANYEITAPDDATPQQLQDYVTKNLMQPQKPAGPAGNAADGGVMSGIVRGLRDPIDAGAQILRRIVPESVAGAIDSFGNQLADWGLPVARSSGVEGVDKLAKDSVAQYEADRAAAGRSGFDAARLTGNVINPVNRFLPGVGRASGLKDLAIAGAKAGAAGGVLQPVTEDTENFWESKAKQAAAGAAGGAVLTPALAKALPALANAGARAVNAVRNGGAGPTVVGGLNRGDLDVAVNRLLQSQGMTMQEAPEAVLNSVRRQISEAMAGGQGVDPAAAMRIARAEAVGLTGDAAMTAAQASRAPIQWAQERNLSGIVMDGGNPLANKFQAQAGALQQVFDQPGAARAVNPNSAGTPLMNSLRAADAPIKQNVDDLYTAARAMNEGRAAELDRAAFSRSANEALNQGMWGRFLPAEVRNLLNDVTDGTTPFNVEAAVQIDSILSAAQRKAARAGDSAGESAIGVVRTALNDAPFAAEQWAARAPTAAQAARAAGVVDNGIDDIVFREVQQGALPNGQRALPAPPSRAMTTETDFQLPPGRQPSMSLSTQVAPEAAEQLSPGEAARRAFEQARSAARSRFAGIEANPAMRAALDNDAPDDFVRRYVLGADARELNALRQSLAENPEALQQVREQIAAHLKRAAFGENMAGDAPFAPERFARTLRNIGPERLGAFFSPQEVMRFNLAAQVAADLASVPAGAKNAVSYNNTAAGIFNLLQTLGNSPVLRNIPGVRGLANQARDIANERAVNAAAAAQPSAATAAAPTQLTPEQVRALQMMLAPAARGAGSTAATGF